MRLDPYFFRLWARLAREVVHVGYPRTNVLYTPAKAGNVWDGETEYPSDADIAVAEQIGHAVAALRLADATLADVLREWYGAYSEAPAKSERLRKLKMAKQRATELVRRAENWIEGWVAARA